MDYKALVVKSELRKVYGIVLRKEIKVLPIGVIYSRGSLDLNSLLHVSHVFCESQFVSVCVCPWYLALASLQLS